MTSRILYKGVVETPIGHYWFSWVAQKTAPYNLGKFLTTCLNTLISAVLFDPPFNAFYFVSQIHMCIQQAAQLNYGISMG